MSEPRWFSQDARKARRLIKTRLEVEAWIRATGDWRTFAVAPPRSLRHEGRRVWGCFSDCGYWQSGNNHRPDYTGVCPLHGGYLLLVKHL
jgi:hypothetical protein